MRIDLNDTKVLRSHELLQGDLAYFHEISRWGFVGQINDFNPVVILDGSSDWRLCQADEIAGYATVASGWTIEIEPESGAKLDHNDDKILSIVQGADGFGIVGRHPSGNGTLVLPLNTSEMSQGTLIAYQTWRVFVKAGEAEQDIFCRTSGQRRRPRDNGNPL